MSSCVFSTLSCRPIDASVLKNFFTFIFCFCTFYFKCFFLFKRYLLTFMKNLPFKKISLYKDNKVRHAFSNNEIFFHNCQILSQSKFSNNLDYYFFKRRVSVGFFSVIKNRCLLSGYSRSVISRVKVSRI